MKKIIPLSLLLGFTFINNSYAACSGEYDKSCGANCCYKMDGTQAIVQDGSTEIGSQAFLRTNITSIEIPSSVTSIGASAFQDTYYLTSINIPSSVTSIGYAAFNHSGINSIEISDSVTSIGEVAFAYSNLSDFSFYDTTVIGGGAFNGTHIKSAVVSCGSDCTLTLDNGKAIITGSGEISNSRGLTGLINEIDIQGDFISIGSAVFKGSQISSIEIPETITSIGGSAFQDAFNLKSINIPDTVTSIGAYAFWNSGIENININGDTSLGVYVFGQTSLQSAYCTTQGMNECLKVINPNVLGKIENNDGAYVFYDPDGEGGIKTKPSRMILSDGTTDYFDDDGQRVRRIGADGEEYTFEYGNVFCYMKDKNGKIMGEFNLDGSPLRRIYTISEANAATLDRYGRYSVSITW